MKTSRHVAVRPTLSPHQDGIVLFIALIALLIISLTAVALIRTVDTATAIAGNLAFKQAATNAGEGAAVEANRWLVGQAAILPVPPATTGPLDSNDLTRGYYAALSTSNTTPNVLRYADATALMATTTWGTANSRAFSDWATNDNSGNQIRYIVERMCRLTGSPQPLLNPGQGCIVGPQEDDGSSKGVGQDTGGPDKPTIVQPVYRITARVQGPRDTVSYIQTFVY